MIEEQIDLQTPDGVADGVLFRPEGAGRRPGVIHYTDIGGIRPAQHGMARRLAEAGYTVWMPNVFYRTGRPPVMDRTLKPGDERARQRFVELSTSLPPDAMERDAASYVDFLAGHPAVSGPALGVVGYCFTGKQALLTAAARPEQIVAAASFHGGGLLTDTSASPHLALPRVRARLYFAHAVQDRSMSPEVIQQFDQALAVWGGQYESEVYDGAFHSWTVPDSPVYNAPQAERAFGKLTELFEQTLQ